jgi:hypothetical protein
LLKQEVRALLALGGNDGFERLQPLAGFLRIEVDRGVVGAEGRSDMVGLLWMVCN